MGSLRERPPREPVADCAFGVPSAESWAWLRPSPKHMRLIKFIRTSRACQPRQLSLPLRTWGGRRPGAGRKPKGDRSEVSHLRRDLVEADSPNAFASGIRAFAIRAGKRLNQALGRTGRLFADRHHRRVLRTQAEVRAALAYVLLNHRRHAAQGVGPLEPRGVDPFSSGAWFTGWKEAVPLPADPPVVQKPRTWLGAVGWKRKGRISLSEVPGDLGRARDDGSPSTLARPGS